MGTASNSTAQMMTFTSPIVLNAIMLASGVRAMALRKLEAMDLYVLGADNFGACPADYAQINDESVCRDAAVALLGTADGFFPVSNPWDMPGCYNWGGVYWNADSSGVPADQTHVDRHRYVCMYQKFHSYDGEWIWIGVNMPEMSVTAEISWSQEESSSTTDDFTLGLEEGVEVGFLGTGISTSSSQTWASSVQNSISNMVGGSSSYACASLSCTEGNLWQWRITGHADTGDEHNTQCSFTCTAHPARATAAATPKCPAGWCGDNDCQCCNGNEWAAQGQDVPLCASATGTTDLTSVCYGCDK